MNPMPRRNNATELEAFQTVCDRLAGFDATLHWEWVDGWLSAQAAGPGLPAPEVWLPALCGDAFDRAFADPADRKQALAALRTRLAVLADQLDAEAMLDDLDALRLEPLMVAWTAADRDAAVAEGAPADDVALLQTGALWSEGFAAGWDALLQRHPLPALDAEDPAQALLDEALAQVLALQLPPDSPEMAAHLQSFHADAERGEADPQGDGDAATPAPTRDDLIDTACYAVQDLRLWWTEVAPVPPTRRVAPTPGRNDPCHCGSGKKFKKCHGA